MDAAEAERAPSFSELPDELLVRMARMLLREDPFDVGRFGCSSRALLQLTHGHAELRAARALVTQQRMSELRDVGLGHAAVEPFLTAVPVLQRLLPDIDASSELAWAPPEPVTRLYLIRPRHRSLAHAKWDMVDPKTRGQAVARLLRVSGALETLHVGRYAFGDFGFARGFKALADGVAASSSLKTLHLEPMAHYGDWGVSAIPDQHLTRCNCPELVAACKSNRIQLTLS